MCTFVLRAGLCLRAALQSPINTARCAGVHPLQTPRFEYLSVFFFFGFVQRTKSHAVIFLVGEAHRRCLPAELQLRLHTELTQLWTG